MEPPVVFALILAMITFPTAPSCGQKIEASQNPLPVGSTVTLTGNANVTTGTWFFEDDLIVMFFNGNPLFSDGRATFNSNNSSVTIKSLQTEDSGVYKLVGIKSFHAELTLNVQVPISGVTLKALETNLVEFNDTAVLMCSVSNGSSLSYEWTRDSSVITVDERRQFSNDGADLTINDVTRLDAGEYICTVSNLLGNEISHGVDLNINYGPSDVIMKIIPEGNNHITGSNITLSCSADSSPSATIQWMVNEVSLNHVGSQLRLEMATEDNSGHYKCLFHNTVTMRFNSASEMIKIVKPIEAVHVNKTDRPVIAGETLTLNCEVTGPVTRIKWWRNQQNISADSSTFLVNETLSLIPVDLSDGGEYQCEAFNEVSKKMSSPLTVTVNYGPMKPEITGPFMALTGTTVKLNCSSDSFPPSDITWHYNDSLLATTPELTIGPLTLSMSGKYTCMAFNSVTNKSSSTYTMLALLEPVTMVEIKADKADPIVDHTFTLTCGTAGSVDSIIWMHDGSRVSANSTRILSADNTTLTFDPVQRVDDGHYQCVASNLLDSSTSANFMLDVFFGPMMPTIVGPKAAIPGDSVTFTCDAASNPPSTYVWIFNDTTVANTSEYVTPPMTSDMGGIYTCMALNNITGKNMTAHTVLAVVDPIMSVHIVAPSTSPIEGHVYTLTCDVTGPAQRVSWWSNHLPVLEDNRTTINMTDKTLKINPIHYNDTGKYECVAFNAAGNVTSPPFMLYVNFGPRIPVIEGPSYGETKQQVLFHCSAHSLPPSQNSWWFNGSQVANTSMFRTRPLTYNMSGEYTCMAYNNVTGENSTVSKMLTVIDAVQSVVITNKTRPIQSKNFTLTCEVTGPFDSIYWKRNGTKLNMDSATNASHHFTKGNMLHFVPLTRNDDGIYQCVATTKALSHHSKPHTLLTNYGPLSVKINASDSAAIGTILHMECVAECRPECDYSWFYSERNVPLLDGHILSFPVTNISTGTYKCKARNPVTKITMYATKAFTADAVGLHTQSKPALMMMGLLALSVNKFFS